LSDYSFPPHYELNDDEHDLYVDLLAQAQDDAMEKVKALREGQRLSEEYDAWVREEERCRIARRGSNW
jgi:hypothetical protein